MQWLLILRVVLGLHMLAHGLTRAVVGTVDDFGGFLAAQGLPASVLLAWAITVTEIDGWFTVGHQVGGAEYGVLLLLCFLLTASTARAGTADLTRDGPFGSGAN